MLGDVDLETIARNIVEAPTRSRARKGLYHGLRALTGVCVGDIGAVIQIYQEILASGLTSVPVTPERQHQVFQDFCARHLYSLSRLNSTLKTVALQFAEASHQLLVESGKEKPTGRIRQYTSLYVRVTSGDVPAQMGRLRELVDAGVFVFTGGTARTKTHDSDPVQQFKLTFRKLYGLANYIGLSDRDRFELSGEDLERWLAEPDAGREILLRNLSRSPSEQTTENSSPEDDAPEDEPRHFTTAPSAATIPTGIQMDLLQGLDEVEIADPAAAIPLVFPAPPVVQELVNEDLDGREVDTLVIGLGFEERTPISLDRLLGLLRPKRILAVRYDHPGHAVSMLEAIRHHGVALIGNDAAPAVLAYLSTASRTGSTARRRSSSSTRAGWRSTTRASPASSAIG